MASVASIRAQVEERLSGRITAPFSARVPTQQPVLPTGIPAIDAAVGGVPCGEITELLALGGVRPAERACNHNCSPWRRKTSFAR
jgi:hypothetical protein